MTMLVVAACSQPGAERPSTSESSTSTLSTPTTLTTSTTTMSETTMSLTTVTTSHTSPPTTSTTVPEEIDVLVFSATVGFRHESIPAGVRALTELGEEHGFAVTATEDASVFTDQGLSDEEVVVFLNTTGDVFDASQQAAMERFVQSGKGFVGIHSATDTEYDWPWYGELVGTWFDRHPRPQDAALEVVAPEHPTMDGIPDSFQRFDEWYDFRSRPDPDVDVLVALEESTYEGGGMGADHPITWAHEYDGGRSFYTGFGHTAETFSEDLVRTLLANAVLWAAGG